MFNFVTPPPSLLFLIKNDSPYITDSPFSSLREGKRHPQKMSNDGLSGDPERVADLTVCLEFRCPLPKDVLYSLIFTADYEQHYFSSMKLGRVQELFSGVTEDGHEMRINEVHIEDGNILPSMAGWIMSDELNQYTTRVIRYDAALSIHSRSRTRNGTYHLSTRVCVTDDVRLENACYISFHNSAWLDVGFLLNLAKPVIIETLKNWINSTVANKVIGMLAHATTYHNTQTRLGCSREQMKTQSLGVSEIQKNASLVQRVQDAPKVRTGPSTKQH